MPRRDFLGSFSTDASFTSTFSSALRSAPTVRLHSHSPAVLLQEPHRSHVPLLAPLEHHRYPQRHVDLKSFPDLLAPFNLSAARMRPITFPAAALPTASLTKANSSGVLSAVERLEQGGLLSESQRSLGFSPKAELVPAKENGAGLLVSGSVRMPSPFVGKHSTPIRGCSHSLGAGQPYPGTWYWDGHNPHMA